MQEKTSTKQKNKLQNLITAIQDHNYNQALEIADELLKKNYKDLDALYLKAVTLVEKKETQEAKEYLNKILKLAPNHLHSLIMLAQFESDDNNIKAAIEIGSKALKLSPQNQEIQFFLIGLYIRNEQYQTARELLHQILKNQPHNTSALSLLALSYGKEENYTEANQYASRALSINPRLVNLRVLIAKFFENNKAEYSSAIKLLQEEIALNPNSREAYSKLGYYYMKTGESEKGIEYIKKQIEISPNNKKSYETLLFFLSYSPHSTNDEILSYANEYDKKFNVVKEVNYINDFSSRKIPDKKLKIGFISGDFRCHALFFWLRGFFKELKKLDCEVFCYCNNEEDSITKEWKLEPNHWISIQNIDNDNLYTLIKNQEIDILIDLSGHTDKNKLDLFQLRPCPIQITWLGQSGPLGIREIDFMISDNYMVNADEEKFYNEKILRLPNIYAPYPDSVNFKSSPAPCIKNKFITFGCFNNFMKINNLVLDTWIDVMSQVENSKLFLKSIVFNDEVTKNRIVQYFTENGITEDRLILESFDNSRENYLKSYEEIDVALDPFPFGGGTTSCDLISMSIPLVTLYGSRQANRSSASLLNTLRFNELIAYDIDEYKKIAIELAKDFSRIQNYKENIRDKYLASPLNDVESFAKNFYYTLKALWQDYCLKE